VKADAALAAFGASGAGICWAVVDSGIAAGHTHFDRWSNLELPFGLAHRDFSSTGDPLTDPHGHGTHVAAILAGQAPGGELGREPRGIAPRAKVISLRVLDEDGCGQVSQILAALDYVRQANDGGRTIRIHGVNLSVGYDFDPEWYACGQSPLCAEVDRLASSGVVVVVSAGNAGYGVVTPLAAGPARACLPYTISDPGNAEQAITVGSTHRDSPHTYGVSYFSSKGPTGDGRAKPDLVAPGERILSAAAPSRAPQGADWRSAYVEDSGTSMAAPHVSGAVAAFLSVRREFIGLPAEIKRIFLQSATDLRRKPDLQGRGLLNLFEALQVR
jgi:subtilisin family serine protease